MSLKETLRQDLSDSIRAKRTERISTLRMLFAAITNQEIESRKKDVGLGDDEVLQVIRREAKKRKDAIVEFEKAGRLELAQTEKDELEILEAFLPPELSDEEVRRIVDEGIRETGATGVGSFGVLMKAISPTLKGRASGERIAHIAREALGG